MNTDRKQIKQRVFSAKPGNFRQSLNRPISGMSSHTFSRKELIQNVYTTQSQAAPIRTASAKALSHRAILGLEKSKKIIVKQSRKKEELEEEIMRLKQTINQLMKELSQQKGKTESMRKKGQKYSKLLSIQFENETHWNSNTLSTHLVTGIRNTYDMLKDKFQSLQQEHQLLLKKKNITKELQYITYIEALERENKMLKDKLEKKMATEIQFGGGQLQSLASSYVIAEIQSNHEHLNQKYNEVSSRYQMCLETLKDRNKKIQFLEKLILQKDNNMHATHRQTKRLKEEIAGLRQTHENMQKDYVYQLDIATKEIQNLKDRIHREKESYEQYMTKEVQVKQFKIAEITKQNQYLHQMSKELRATNNQLNKKVQQLKSNNTNTNILEAFVLPAFTQLQMNYLGQHQKTVSNPTSRAEQFQGNYSNGMRIPQKADKKHHQHAVKCRKIAKQQVIQIVQFARLKLIEAKFSLSKVKQLFDFNPGSNTGSWEQQYITMKQVKQILTFPPFSLNNNYSETLARYLVEDVQADYVYCDDFNENTREIVKSIMKNLLGEYPLCIENSDLDIQVKIFLNTYSKILEDTLTKMDYSGKISDKRFQEALKFLGIACSQSIRMIMLGRMAKKAQYIDQLDYRELFK